MNSSEFDIIKKYFTFLDQRRDVILPAGDDCAIVDAGQHHPDSCSAIAVTTDTLVSGIHFPVQTCAADIAFKALMVNLSDLAAMGAEPAWLCLSLTLPEIKHPWLSEFSAQLKQTLAENDISLIGGDTTRGPLSITMQAMGLLNKAKAMRRNQARPGDRIFVTGTLGDAAIGLRCVTENLDDPALADCVHKLNRPQARNRFALALVNYCDCAIDISDGLLADLGHLLEASHCGAIIQQAAIPISTAAAYYCDHYCQHQTDWSMVLSHGDDYELCFTVAADKVAAVEKLADTLSLPVSCIGEITEEKSLICVDKHNKPVNYTMLGYQHFNQHVSK